VTFGFFTVRWDGPGRSDQALFVCVSAPVLFFGDFSNKNGAQQSSLIQGFSGNHRDPRACCPHLITHLRVCVCVPDSGQRPPLTLPAPSFSSFLSYTQLFCVAFFFPCVAFFLKSLFFFDGFWRIFFSCCRVLVRGTDSVSLKNFGPFPFFRLQFWLFGPFRPCLRIRIRGLCRTDPVPLVRRPLFPRSKRFSVFEMYRARSQLFQVQCTPFPDRRQVYRKGPASFLFFSPNWWRTGLSCLGDNPFLKSLARQG